MHQKGLNYSWLFPSSDNEFLLLWMAASFSFLCKCPYGIQAGPHTEPTQKQNYYLVWFSVSALPWCNKNKLEFHVYCTFQNCIFVYTYEYVHRRINKMRFEGLSSGKEKHTHQQISKFLIWKGIIMLCCSSFLSLWTTLYIHELPIRMEMH